MIPHFYSLPEQVTLWLKNPRQSESESAHGRRRRKKPKEPLCHGRDSDPGPQSHEHSALFTRLRHPALLSSIAYISRPQL